MNVYSYLRVSGRSQVEGDGFERQRQKIGQWAKLNRAEVVHEFVDEGISGTSEMADRPALSALLLAIMGNGVRVVVVEKADRLARDLIVSELILRQFHELGVTVFEAEGGTDLTAGDGGNPTAKLIRQILAAVAEFDKTSIVLKTRAARERIRRQVGRCEGRKPLGFREGEAAIVERIRQLRRKPVGGKRLSFAGIAARLDAEGVPTRYGRLWAASTVRQALQRRGAS